MNRAALVVMAAGMASRYGGNKQIEGMGPNGEILMEYSIQDAINAGFTKVVFIIKREMLDVMKELCGDRFARQVEVCYAFQDFSTIPDFYTIPEGRVKPFGTVHAVLCARSCISEPFAVLNADDYYGVESFAQMYEFLTGECSPVRAAMMGYRLCNTVSKHGTVSRGICRIEDGVLTGVREAKKIRLMEDGGIFEVSHEDAPEKLDPASLVSMNFWGFHPDVFNLMQDYFEEFLRRAADDDVTCECLLPVMVDRLIRSDRLSVSVIDTPARWFGVTYKEDRPFVVAALQGVPAPRSCRADGVSSQSLPR